jgi:hypothetical protein
LIYWLDRSAFRRVVVEACDLMGRLAGFRLEARHADWSGAPFTAESTRRIAVYQVTSPSQLPASFAGG